MSSLCYERLLTTRNVVPLNFYARFSPARICIEQ
jgi:hypothetical protein